MQPLEAAFFMIYFLKSTKLTALQPANRSGDAVRHAPGLRRASVRLPERAKLKT